MNLGGSNPPHQNIQLTTPTQISIVQSAVPPQNTAGAFFYQIVNSSQQQQEQPQQQQFSVIGLPSLYPTYGIIQNGQLKPTIQNYQVVPQNGQNVQGLISLPLQLQQSPLFLPQQPLQYGHINLLGTSGHAPPPSGGNPDLKVGKKKKKLKFDGMTSEEIALKVLPDYLRTGLDVVFIGLNPSLHSAWSGRYYDGPGNHFWQALHQSGLVEKAVKDDRRLLDLGFGFTNLIARPTRSSGELSRLELEQGAALLRSKLQLYQPKIAVFNGKLIYQIFSNSKQFQFGLQPAKMAGTDIAEWVMPNSSARCSLLPRAVDKVPLFIGLRKYLGFISGKEARPDESELVFANLPPNPSPKKVLKEEFILKKEEMPSTSRLSSVQLSERGSSRPGARDGTCRPNSPARRASLSQKSDDSTDDDLEMPVLEAEFPLPYSSSSNPSFQQKSSTELSSSKPSFQQKSSTDPSSRNPSFQQKTSTNLSSSNPSFQQKSSINPSSSNPSFQRKSRNNSSSKNPPFHQKSSTKPFPSPSKPTSRPILDAMHPSQTMKPKEIARPEVCCNPTRVQEPVITQPCLKRKSNNKERDYVGSSSSQERPKTSDKCYKKQRKVSLSSDSEDEAGRPASPEDTEAVFDKLIQTNNASRVRKTELEAASSPLLSPPSLSMKTVQPPPSPSKLSASPVKLEGMTSIWGKNVSSFDLPEDYVKDYLEEQKRKIEDESPSLLKIEEESPSLLMVAPTRSKVKSRSGSLDVIPACLPESVGSEIEDILQSGFDGEEQYLLSPLSSGSNNSKSNRKGSLKMKPKKLRNKSRDNLHPNLLPEDYLDEVIGQYFNAESSGAEEDEAQQEKALKIETDESTDEEVPVKARIRPPASFYSMDFLDELDVEAGEEEELGVFETATEEKVKKVKTELELEAEYRHILYGGKKKKTPKLGYGKKKKKNSLKDSEPNVQKSKNKQKKKKKKNGRVVKNSSARKEPETLPPRSRSSAHITPESFSSRLLGATAAPSLQSRTRSGAHEASFSRARSTSAQVPSEPATPTKTRNATNDSSTPRIRCAVTTAEVSSEAIEPRLTSLAWKGKKASGRAYARSDMRQMTKRPFTSSKIEDVTGKYGKEEELVTCGICEMLDPSVEDLPPEDTEVEWVGCDCYRWFHKPCTKLMKFTEKFSCRSVRMKCLEERPEPVKLVPVIQRAMVIFAPDIPRFMIKNLR